MSAINDIAAERRRQIDAEGWSVEHDDDNSEGQMAAAAATYAWIASFDDARRAEASTNSRGGYINLLRYIWPRDWAIKWFKPTNPRRDLVKAGALIAAEIERLDRAAGTASTEPQWVRVDDFRGEPNTGPMAWWVNESGRIELDEVLLGDEGEVVGKGGCGASFCTHVRLALPHEIPAPPTTTRG
ncbi:hypothetical protein [Azospirillum sp. TSO5]|uniref:hypothetical protein n=1 Tax=Azospirillum sp. TSO5 TaxID=716760 RepID=UPI000D646D62|nr:hypothetical protein [Azospirillum sp. TSO5]